MRKRCSIQQGDKKITVDQQQIPEKSTVSTVPFLPGVQGPLKLENEIH